jgi:hypothetical protein
MKATRIASVLMLMTFFIHVFWGGPEVHDALQNILREPILGAFAAVLWHAVSVVLAALALGLWALSARRDPVLEAVLSGIQLGFAALFIVYGLVRVETLWLMPQWVIFLTIPAVTRLGQARRVAPPAPL